MSKTTTKEVRNLSDSEISDKIQNLRKELFDLRFKQATRQLAKTHRFKEARTESVSYTHLTLPTTTPV